jgi:hypothetical protein
VVAGGGNVVVVDVVPWVDVDVDVVVGVEGLELHDARTAAAARRRAAGRATGRIANPDCRRRT